MNNKRKFKKAAKKDIKNRGENFKGFRSLFKLSSKGKKHKNWL